MRPTFAALALAAALAAPARAADLRYFDDAALHAVQFVDQHEGWAVGDEGVVWHSIDGGQHWERQPTGVRASLRCVHFLTPYLGWVAGREELPHGGSGGVILVTRDGGLKWQRLGANALPGLHRIRFFDDKNGLACGEGSDDYPTGLFATADGGRTWKPVAGPRCPGWLAADFSDLATGAMAGAWSRMATLRKGVLGAAEADALCGRSMCGLQLDGNRAVAVGQGGAVLVSSNSAGEKWGFADLRLPPDVLANLDFHAVCCRKGRVWVVGRPGSVVLHSKDGGQSWETQATGQSLPLRGVFFLDSQLGWAVGELGSVLATTDGGKTWAVQRHGGERAAVLCVHARPTGFPLDAVALLGGEDGYLTAALRVTAPDPASASQRLAGEPFKPGAALRQAGGAAGEMLWQFPVPQHLDHADPEGLVAAWDKLHGNHAADQLLRQMVLAIRMWQPEVVLTDWDGKVPSHPLVSFSDCAPERLVAEAVKEAFTRAADPKAFPEQIERLGLKPWSVKKLYGRVAYREDAQIMLDGTDPLPRLRATANDVAGAAAALLIDGAADAPSGYRLLARRLDGADKHRDLMQGITLAPGGTARRKLDEVLEPDEAANKTVRAKRNLQTIGQTPLAGLTDPDRLLGQIGSTLETLPEEQGAPAALAIARQFADAGQWTLAREAFLLMAERYPTNPLTADAYRWLIRYNSSSEARRRHELGQFLVMTQTTINQQSGSKDRPGPDDLRTTQRGKMAVLGSLEQARRWYQGSLDLDLRLATFGPLFANDPALQFCVQAARRNLGDFDKAREWYTRFLANHVDGPWHDAAAAELWLINRQGPPPKPATICRYAVKRPYLDGVLDDDCWQGLKPLRLRNAVGKTVREKTPGAAEETSEPDYPTEAWFAYDKDFLYVALRCRHPADRWVAPVAKRRRDENLRPYDRVAILLDLDRDYSTCFHLEIDQRGCLFEDCWGDKSWNPRWFVALRSEPTCWQIEAAIPLIELTGEAVTSGRAWAVNVTRILPGRGVQAWSLPADVKPRPEGMGLLLFLEEAQRAATAEAGRPAPPGPMPPADRLPPRQ